MAAKKTADGAEVVEEVAAEAPAEVVAEEAPVPVVTEVVEPEPIEATVVTNIETADGTIITDNTNVEELPEVATAFEEVVLGDGTVQTNYK